MNGFVRWQCVVWHVGLTCGSVLCDMLDWHVAVCCVTCWTDIRIIPVTSECADVSLHNRAFYCVRSSHSTVAMSKNERSYTATPSYASQIYRVFHNVLRITRNYETVQIEETIEKFFFQYIAFHRSSHFCRWTMRVVMARQGYHQNIPCGATTPLGRSCRMGVPERGGGNKAVYCLNNSLLQLLP